MVAFGVIRCTGEDLRVSAISVRPVEGDELVAVQSLYVVPHRRGNGFGGKLIDAIVGLADELGLKRVTVQANKEAVNAYTRHGFSNSPGLLHAETPNYRGVR